MVKSNMKIKRTFQSIIALHQEEFPFMLNEREWELPIQNSRIVTVTGIRRCGKSSLLGLAVNKLLQAGVSNERILFVGFDDERLIGLKAEHLDEILQSYREMYPTIHLKDVYMFFDEIQLVEGWELFVLRVYKNYCKNIFITGSTAKMLSAEMTSALRGWPDEYREYTLNFQEYLKFKRVKVNKYTESGAAILANEFRAYCKEGGFPQVVLTDGQSEKVKVLQSYFNTMLFRDMMEHYHISSPSEVVRYFLKRVMNNLTKPTSVNNIYNELKSQGMKVSKDSLYLWLDYACNIFLFHRVPKYTRSLVKERAMPAKYYVADTGLCNAVLLSQSEDEGKALENIVYLMLERTIGVDGRIFYFSENSECDFVVQHGDNVSELIQVCWELNEQNREREVGGLCAAAEATHCQKCKIITFNQTDTLTAGDITIEVLPVWMC
jgi:predicted AAA+ superfamily ATPase